MGENTRISWATHTWNPWIGCEKVHAGCDNCYAQDYFKRFSIDGVRRRASDAIWAKPLKWDKEAARRDAEYVAWEESASQQDFGYIVGPPPRPRIFPSLCDPFEDWQGPIVDAKGEQLATSPLGPCAMVSKPRFETLPDDHYPDATIHDLRRGMFNIIDQTLNLDYLLLTKRPGNILPMWPMTPGTPAHLVGVDPATRRPTEYMFRPNVHLLYSASNQETLEAGIGHLLECRDLVPVLGLSLEPLIGPVDLKTYLLFFMQESDGPFIQPWVIVGGESGPNARPCQLEWILDIVQQCKAAGVACFVKQLGANATVGYEGLVSFHWRPAVKWLPQRRAMVKQKDPKGDDPAEWPEELRVQEYPKVAK